MKAIQIHGYGGSDQLQLEETTRPKIEPHQVLVRIHDAGVNPVDWKIREGRLGRDLSQAFPMTMGRDFAGEIVEVGSNVRGFNIGDAVFGFAPGSYAEFAAVDLDSIARIPESVDFETAASLPTAGLTAWQSITEATNISSDQTILIQGAAGGVGSIAVQIAKSRGARVFATASSSDSEYLLNLGVERVIDYRAEKFEDIVHDFDAVLDLVGGDTLKRSYGVVKPGGVVVTTVGPLDESEAKKRGVRGIQFIMRGDFNGLAQLADLVRRGVVKPRVAEVMPLEDARRAHDINQKGHSHGKIILHVT